MASDYDPAEFVDSDFQAHKTPQSSITPGLAAAAAQRAPSREEVDSRLAEAQRQLAEIQRAKEDLERQRTALEETRRRQAEFQTGRQEMIENLTRGVGLLEEAEFNARRDAEQMAKALGEFRDALSNIQSIQEQTWTEQTFNVELTRALTTLENARMEWNGARLKFPLLSGQLPARPETAPPPGAHDAAPLSRLGFGELCKLGLALNWPVTLIALTALVVWMIYLFR